MAPTPEHAVRENTIAARIAARESEFTIEAFLSRAVRPSLTEA
jgi:hypothetical protein